MRRRAAFLALSLIGLSGCAAVTQQYHPAEPKFVVFYSPWGATLDAKGLAVVSQAAQAALKDPASTVQVVGFASTVGTDADNQALSEQRASNVLNQIVADGVPASRVTSMARGATTYELSPIEARRVEIDIIHAGF
ncbi:OmpA family protein [Acidisoma cellulosilytica]|uniref:OmpA family protein n=1 Tax=Acidisoma cellulosilyticum TaxID=2802395 RepID=A0A963YZJ3_9PROT|nr:OmpA family protein [Acidisoma cellulosilyticum]MCB8879964.1 OmpA family protein [Acidisoma cellulosilyticum]